MPAQPSQTWHATPIVDTTTALVIGLLLVVLLLLLQFRCYRPPTALPIDAAPELFSADRAAAALQFVLGSQKTHPTGSSANHEVRDRIISRLVELGYRPEVQRGRACDEFGDCATVENIVVRVEGQKTGSAIALTAHYDSVAASPGAADDGIGIATLLEIARALKSGRKPAHHAVVLLLTDGEETGLLGARVFVDQHPWASDIRAAVNLEARGNAGPSFMFETGSDNAQVMAWYRSVVARPITNSIYYTAYKLLPNDTDFTVYKAAGWQGYNFALTTHVQHYHTPLDTLDHLSLNSLQHHGDNALSMLAALDAGLASAPARGNASISREAVYVDILARYVLVWPVTWALPMALGSTALWLLILGLQRRIGIQSLAWAAAAHLLAFMFAALATILLLAALRAVGAIPPSMAVHGWTAYPLPLEISTVSTSAMALLLTSWLFRPRSCLRGWWAANALLLVVASIASAALLPGLSFAFQIPLLVLLLATVAGWALPADGAGSSLSLVLTALADVLVLAPTIGFLQQGLGPNVLPLVAVLAVWVMMPLMGLLAGSPFRLFAGLAVAALTVGFGAAAMAAFHSPYSPESPQRLNLEYLVDADLGRAEWLAKPDSGTLPPNLARAANFVRSTTQQHPWSRGPVWRAEADDSALPGPEFRLLSSSSTGGIRSYRAELRSPRGASSISLCWPPGHLPSDITLAGVPVRAPDAVSPRAGRAGWYCLSEHTLDSDGIRLAFTVPNDRPFEALLSDSSPGLPASGLSLLTARAPEGTQSRDGDVTRVLRRVPIGQP